MKRSAYLINTSRGPVVDEEALAWALRTRLIAGAALDVYEDEPEVEPELLTLENVAARPASRQRDRRDAHGDGRSRRSQRRGGSIRPTSAHAGSVTISTPALDAGNLPTAPAAGAQ